MFPLLLLHFANSYSNIKAQFSHCPTQESLLDSAVPPLSLFLPLLKLTLEGQERFALAPGL